VREVALLHGDRPSGCLHSATYIWRSAAIEWFESLFASFGFGEPQLRWVSLAPSIQCNSPVEVLSIS
jgi:hypothetical protein